MTTVANYPALGFDPTPGDPDTVLDLHGQLKSVADEIAHVYEILTGATPDHWRGKAADAFRSNIHDELTPALEKAHESFAGAASALDGWQREMLDYQAQSRRLEQQAAELQESIRHAQWLLESLPASPRDSTLPDPDAAERSRLRSNISGWNDELAAVRRRAHAHTDDYNRAGTSYAVEFHDAEKIAPHKPGWFESLVDDIHKIGQAIAALPGEIDNLYHYFVENFQQLLAKISDALSMISAITAFLALIPPLTGVMLPISMVTAGLATAGHAAEIVFYGDGNWLDVGLDALGAVSGLGTMRLLGKVASLSKDVREVRTFGGAARLFGGAAKDTRAAREAASAAKTGAEDADAASREAATGLEDGTTVTRSAVNRVFPKVAIPQRGFVRTWVACATGEVKEMELEETAWTLASMHLASRSGVMTVVAAYRTGEHLAGHDSSESEANEAAASIGDNGPS